MSVVTANNLKKSFKKRIVVKGVNIRIHSGEIVGLLGRNGAGKTTTFKMIVGLLKPDSGANYLDDTNISNFTTPQRSEKGIIYLPQENSVFLKTNVKNNLKLILELQGHPKERQETIAHNLLQELGLLSLSKQPAHSLSGGERRKLEICRSLLLNPKFLLLDEPFTGIDPLTIIELQKILNNLKNKGMGILLSDHNVGDTFKIADRVYIIDEGKILIEGKPHDVAKDETAKIKFLGKNFQMEELYRAPH
ncbi:LPS export ABC transporter ATP-binding protein [bacterium]|nr:LPS export ABC transporter ATP-binding protein [bacterium]